MVYCCGNNNSNFVYSIFDSYLNLQEKTRQKEKGKALQKFVM